MVAKKVLGDYNSFVISLFSIGLGLGPLVFQQLTAFIVDNLKPASKSFLGFENFDSTYTIAHMIFLSSFLSFITFLVIVLIYKKFVYLIR
jgi:hypothetical protein